MHTKTTIVSSYTIIIPPLQDQNCRPCSTNASLSVAHQGILPLTGSGGQLFGITRLPQPQNTNFGQMEVKGLSKIHSKPPSHTIPFYLMHQCLLSLSFFRSNNANLDPGISYSFLGRAATSSGGKNLNLSAKVQWFGHRGMQWHQLDPAIMDPLKRKAPPNYLMIHSGSNDLAKSHITSKN